MSDEYYTPLRVWKSIKHLLPLNKTAWEAFVMDDERSPQYMKELGIPVTYKKGQDFFKANEGDYILSNPPFSKKQLIINRCVKLQKPFVMVFPIYSLCAKYINKLKDDLQVIIPDKLMTFETKHDDHNHPLFHSVFLCYKMNFDKDVNWVSADFDSTNTMRKHYRDSITCECGVSYTRKNKARHIKSQFHQKFTNTYLNNSIDG